jgi:agmatine deiminase
VSSSSQQSSATNQFWAAGANMGKVQFIIKPTNSIWLRDYGPHFIWQSGARAIVDSHYYPSRTLDNFIPTLVADDHFVIPSYDMGLYYSGGNFQPGAGRSGFVTSLINQDNPTHGEEFIAELYHTHQGIDTLHVMPRLPSNVDGTGHIDMWLYLVDDDTAIVSEFIPGSNSTAIQITNDAAEYMAGLGYEVFRIPDSNSYHPYDPYCHFTYTNAYRVNDRIFIPTYGQGDPTHLTRDAEALATWQAAAPEAEIIPIDCYDIIWAAGAIHCIVMQVPRHTDPLPSAHVIAPAGGELLVGGNTYDLEWVADDDVEVTSIDLTYSTDGGDTFPYEIAVDLENDGHHDWTVPEIVSADMVVKLVAGDVDENEGEAVSERSCAVTDAPQSVYDFANDAGEDKWGWGYQTYSWSSLDGVRRPADVQTEIDQLQSGAYQKIAASDADGSDGDADRYRSPSPSSGRESTHIFEFLIAEEPTSILDIGIEWEGYGDDCIQMELYVWDYVDGNWCDGNNRSGENRYIDNFAGNRDAILRGHIRNDIERYLDDGMLTILLYGERSSQESFHDYLAVTVTYALLGDLDHDGSVGAADLAILLGSWGPCPPEGGCPADLNGDGVVDATDLAMLLGNWG